MGLFAQLQSIQAGYRNVFMCFHENIGLNSGCDAAGQ